MILINSALTFHSMVSNRIRRKMAAQRSGRMTSTDRIQHDLDSTPHQEEVDRRDRSVLVAPLYEHGLAAGG